MDLVGNTTNVKTMDSKDVAKNRSFVDFLDRQILKLEEELECPVCLEVATTAPIYKCPEDHLICRLSINKFPCSFISSFIAGFAGQNYQSALNAGLPWRRASPTGGFEELRGRQRGSLNSGWKNWPLLSEKKINILRQ